MPFISWVLLFLMGAVCFAATESSKQITAKPLSKLKDFDMEIVERAQVQEIPVRD